MLYYTTITCQNFSFVLFLYLKIFWLAWRHFLTLFNDFGWVPWQRGTIFSLFLDIFKTVNIYTLYLDTSHWFESPFKNWDIMANVKTSSAPFRGFWLVSMVTGYHFEFFMTFLKFLIYIISIWTQVINLGVLSKSLVYSPLNNDSASRNLNKKCFIYFHNRNYWQGKY